MEKSVKYHCQYTRNWLTRALIIFALFCIQLLVAINVSYAGSSNSNIRIKFTDNLIDISVKNTELKAVLLKLAEITNTYIEFPPSLKKKVSINKQNISLRQTLIRLLKNFNYIILYSGPDKLKASVSKVFVFSKAKKASRLNASQRRTTNRIKNYERQIESIKRRLSNVDQNSSSGKRYLRRIKRIEKKIDRLRRE